MIQKRKIEQPRTKQEGKSEFMRRGPFPNQKEFDLHLLSACLSGRTTLAKDALDKGANPNAKDPDGKTMLMIVAMENFYEIGKLLIAAKRTPRQKTRMDSVRSLMSNMFGSKDMRRLLERSGLALWNFDFS